MHADTRILLLARSIRSDAWVDFAARGAYSVGFANNADPAAYNEAMDDLSERLREEGFKVRVRTGDERHACTLVTVLDQW